MAPSAEAAAETALPADAPALARAERARRNGARSRGPRTEAGKARSSRNALKHGLTARVHLLQPGEDEPAFEGRAGCLFAELAPTGEVDGFLVANLAAAMWRTGRAHQLEGRACAGGEGPDERRLGLALRYHGSASRELFRSLRALQELRRRPLAVQPSAPASGAVPSTADEAPMAAAAPGAIPAVARLAWGGACAPAPPPGCMMLRPVPERPPESWRYLQYKAFPGAEPVPVDADGIAYALVDGAWMPKPASVPPTPPIPDAPPPARRPSAPSTPAAAAAAPTLRHNLTLADLAEPVDLGPYPDVDADPEPCPRPDSQRRNEPRNCTIEPHVPSATGSSGGAASMVASSPRTDDPSRWYLMWGLVPPEAAVAAEELAPTSPPILPAGERQPAPLGGVPDASSDSEPPSSARPRAEPTASGHRSRPARFKPASCVQPVDPRRYLDRPPRGSDR
jgi:hypothetical protein